jgi:hypothetical protein
MPLYFDTRDDLKESLSVRRWREANKAAYFEVGMEFEQKIKPTKFEATAASRYGFKPRSPKYLKRKQGGYIRTASGQRYAIPHGGTRDLVLTGRLKALMMRRYFPRVFPTRVTIQYQSPVSDRGYRYATMRPYKSNHPNLGEELTSITPEQFKRLEAIYHDKIEKEVKL